MSPSHRLTLGLTFTLSLLLAMLAFIQTPEFTVNFKSLSQTALIRKLAPHSENLLNFQSFLAEAKLSRGQPNAAHTMCQLFGEKFHFDPDFKINHKDLTTAYKVMLATCLLDGSVAPKNPALAAEIVNKLDDLPPNASAALGALFMESSQPDVGRKLLERSERQGNILASAQLASYSMNGSTKGFPLDWARAYELFKKAADGGEPSSALNVAIIALEGRVDSAPPANFRLYLERSLALKEDKAAALTQAWAYAEGIDYPKDPAKARELEALAQTYSTKSQFYVTDFFNSQGWGDNASVTQNLLLYFYGHKLVKLSAQRDYFFTPTGPTPLYQQLEKDLTSSSLDQVQVRQFLREFSTTPAEKPAATPNKVN